MPPTGANTKVKDTEYCNWLKVGLALYYLKVGLSSFIQDEVDAMHKFLIQKLYNGSAVPASQCSSCNAKNVKQNRYSYTWKFQTPCPQRLCDTWLTELLALHTNPTSNKLYCENCNVTAWPSASWECAKLYMPRGQTVTNIDPSQSDSQALLTLMANCKYFHSKLSQGGIQLTQTVSKIRNTVMHSGDMRLLDKDRKSFIQDIINLLEDPNHLKSLEECKQAVAEINKINNDSLDVFFNIDSEMKALRVCVNDCRKELGVHKVETEKTVDSLKEELKDLKVEFDSFEKKTKDNDKKMGTRVKKLSRTVTYVNGQVRTQRAVIKKTVDSLKRKAVTDRSQQDKKLRKLDQEMQLIKGSNSEASRATAVKFGDLDTKVTKLSRTVVNVKSGLYDVQRHVTTQNKRSSLIKKRVLTDLNRQRIIVRKLDQQMRLRKGSTSQAGKVSEKNMESDVRDIQMSLIKAYESVQIISINPVFDTAVNWKDLEDFYTDIVIEEEEEEESTQKIKDEQQFNKIVMSFRHIFEKDGKKVNRIILKAPAGQGKSTFCRKLVHTWCSVQKKKLNLLIDARISDKSETSGLKDEDEMLRFDVLLYVCLRDISDEKTLMDVVNTQFPLDESEGLSHNCHIESLIRQAEDNKVLLIMDGLDEMDNSSTFIDKIMQRRLYPHLTVLATTRPWKIGQLCLIRSAHIDLFLDLKGFSHKNSMLFAKRIFDKYYTDESAIAQFKNDIWTNDVIISLIHLPLFLLFIVHVWYERKSFPQTIHELYLEMLNVMVNRYMEGKERIEQNKGRRDQKKQCLPKTWPLESTTFIVNPKLRKLSLVKHFGEEFLATLCEVANHFLVTAHGETSLVFDEEAFLELLGKDGTLKLQTALDLGILSKSESRGIFRKRICLSFLHKTVQEFLAAINICCREDRCTIFLDSLNTLDDVFQNEEIIKFAAGISTTKCQKIFEKIYEVCDKERAVLLRSYRMHILSRFYIDCIREACGEPLNLKLYCVDAHDQKDWNELQSALRNTLSIRIHLKYLYLYSCILDDAALDLVEFKYLTKLQLVHMTIKGKLLLSKCTELKGLVLCYCTLDDDVLDLSESKCLEYLRLVDVTMKGKLLLSKCAQLKYLKLNECKLDDTILDLSESKCLEHLRLKDVTMKVKLLLSKCTHLKCLKLNDCILDDTILDLSESNCLEYLSLKDLTMKFRLLLSKCTQLKCLKLSSCILEVAVFDLSECTCLEWFVCYKVTMTGRSRLLCTQPQELILVKCNLGEFTLDLSVSACLIKQIPQLQNTSVENADLDDALLSVNYLHKLNLDNVTMSKECKEVFCNHLSHCKQLQTLSIKEVDLCDALLSLDSLDFLDELNLDNVTMSKECKEVFCNSLSQCKQLQTLSIKNVDLCDALLSLESLNYLHELNLDNVTMSKECKEVFCNSLSQCKQLQTLSIKNVDLCDALLSLDSLNYLHELNLDNVTMSKECKEVFCNRLFQCKQLQTLSIKEVDLCDALLSLDSLDFLDAFNLDNVTMRKECKKVFCNSLSQCKQLHRLSIKNVDLCDELLSLDSVNYLIELNLDNVTMSKECKKVFCNSLSHCKKLPRLSIKNVDLCDELLSLDSVNYLIELNLDNVTMSKECKEVFCNSLFQCKQLHRLSIKNMELCDGLHELYNMKRLNDITLENVNMGTLSKVLMCKSLSQCTQIKDLSLKNLNMDDGLLSLNKLGIQRSLTIDHVTMCKDGYLMLFNYISTCAHLTLSLKNLDLGDAIPKLDNLWQLELVNITMSLECVDYIKSPKPCFFSSMSFEHKTTLSIEMTASSCDKCVVNYTNIIVIGDDDDDDDDDLDDVYDG